jgi:ribosomal protein S27AE
MSCAPVLAKGLEGLLLEGVLEAIDGVAWVTDRAGSIVAVGATGWTDFAQAAQASAPAPQEVLGRSLFSFMLGADVQEHYRQLHQAAWSGHRRIAITIRCDAPEVQRRIRLAMTPLTHSGNVAGVLYQCQVLSEQARPPIRFLSPQAAVEDVIGDKAPILNVCSFCADVAMSDIGGGQWLAAEEYYRLGGESRVRLSHGICPNCAETASDYMLADGPVCSDHTRR